MRNMESDLLFVYGTLRNGLGHPMARLLARFASHVGPARMRGRLYSFGAYPGLVLTNHPACRVRGDLYRMYRPADLLRVLDDYEECADHYLRPHEYRRELAPAEQPGRTHMAWVYVYNWKTTGRRLIANGDFLTG